MRVRCIAEMPDEAQVARLGGAEALRDRAFSLQLGQEYLVYGIETAGDMVWIYIADEYEQLSPVPICLFSVEDSRVPSDWDVHVAEDWGVFIGFATLMRGGFMDDLLAGNSAALDEFRRMSASFREEGE